MKVFVVRGAVAKDALNLNIKAGLEVWLGWTNEGGGWHEWTKHKEGAHPFEAEANAREAAQKCSGPWFYVPDPKSIVLHDADYTPATAARLWVGAAL